MTQSTQNERGQSIEWNIRSYQRQLSISERTSWHSLIFATYDKMRAPRCTYEIYWKERALTVLPDVYAPQFFTDSFWFAEVLPQIVSDRSLLEIGAGTGIISIACALNGATVTATDISPAAVRNTTINSQQQRVKIDCRIGDVYAPVREDERFDFIFWAHPFNNWTEPVTDLLLRTGLDFGYQGIRAYFAGASQHLSKNGRLLLGTGDSADLATIMRCAETEHFAATLVRDAELPLAFGAKERVRYMVLSFMRDKE